MESYAGKTPTNTHPPSQIQKTKQNTFLGLHDHNHNQSLQLEELHNDHKH